MLLTPLLKYFCTYLPRQIAKCLLSPATSFSDHREVRSMVIFSSASPRQNPSLGEFVRNAKNRESKCRCS